MAYRKFKAERLFDGYRFLGNDKVLITDDAGKVQDIVSSSDASEGIEEINGILSPGLFNCHCHLELSHLKNVIPPHTGLIEFLCSVVTKRETLSDSSPEGELSQVSAIRKMNAISAAEKEMYDNGIVAVGDIGNTADTAEVKSQSKIRWQNFVEVLGFTDEKAEENISLYKKVADDLNAALSGSGTIFRTSLVPHAPYSISPKTFRLINEATANQIISIHNQEHPAEDELYKTGGGAYLKLFNLFGIERSPFPVTGKSSIRSCLTFFNNGQTILLVHNTFMPEEDVQWANEYAVAKGLKLVYCLCVNANLYIENKLPPVEMLMKNNCHIVLGTDSYSSNWQLSIAKEIETLQNHFPDIPLETFVQWATANGARALQWHDEAGGFEKGKRPGLVQTDTETWLSKRIL
jgi:cytosine/adenosine deaminase-related metal-dependent hydrolase